MREQRPKPRYRGSGDGDDPEDDKQKQHQNDADQEPRAREGGARQPAKSKKCGNRCNDKKNENEFQHGICPLKNPVEAEHRSGGFVPRRSTLGSLGSLDKTLGRIDDDAAGGQVHCRNDRRCEWQQNRGLKARPMHFQQIARAVV